MRTRTKTRRRRERGYLRWCPPRDSTAFTKCWCKVLVQRILGARMDRSLVQDGNLDIKRPERKYFAASAALLLVDAIWWYLVIFSGEHGARSDALNSNAQGLTRHKLVDAARLVLDTMLLSLSLLQLPDLCGRCQRPRKPACTRSTCGGLRANDRAPGEDELGCCCCWLREFGGLIWSDKSGPAAAGETQMLVSWLGIFGSSLLKLECCIVIREFCPELLTCWERALGLLTTSRRRCVETDQDQTRSYKQKEFTRLAIDWSCSHRNCISRFSVDFTLVFRRKQQASTTDGRRPPAAAAPRDVDGSKQTPHNETSGQVRYWSAAAGWRKWQQKHGERWAESRGQLQITNIGASTAASLPEDAAMHSILEFEPNWEK
jgi:hypothetical protein